MIIVSDSWDGKVRKLSSRVCLQCNKDFFAPLSRKTKYCGRDCCRESQRTKVIVSCARCLTNFQRDPSKLKENNYCSRKCKELDQHIGGPLALSHYKEGRWDYRTRAFRLQGKVCRLCSFNDDARMLDVHHIDSDRSNGHVENLVVLCVWCHALYTRGLMGPSPNWDGISPARRNNVGSTPTGSTNFLK